MVVDLGLLPYAEALDLQRATAAARIAGAIPDDVLLLVEHPPVVTLGRSARLAHLMASPALLKARGVALFEVERGGDVTYHGPGQLVGYPVIDLKAHRRDLHWYLRQVEESIIRALSTFGLACTRNAGFTGVWTGGQATDPPSGGSSVPGPTGASAAGSPHGAPGLRKIASIGVHARDWVTWHGFALNVTTDLSNFGLIVPCGISGVTMTTVERELGERFPGNAAVTDAVVRSFAEVFDLAVDVRSPAWLDSKAGVVAAPDHGPASNG